MKPFIKFTYNCFIQELQASPVVKAHVFFSQGEKYCSKHFKNWYMDNIHNAMVSGFVQAVWNTKTYGLCKSPLLGYPYYFAEFNWHMERRNIDRVEEEAIEDYQKVLQFFIICSWVVICPRTKKLNYEIIFRSNDGRKYFKRVKVQASAVSKETLYTGPVLQSLHSP